MNGIFRFGQTHIFALILVLYTFHNIHNAIFGFVRMLAYTIAERRHTKKKKNTISTKWMEIFFGTVNILDGQCGAAVEYMRYKFTTHNTDLVHTVQADSCSQYSTI